MSSNQLTLKDLHLTTHIGIYDWEFNHPQTLIINITFTLKSSKHPIQLADTVDYDQLCRSLAAYRQQHFDLLENFTIQLARDLLQRFPCCDQVSIKAIKQVNLIGKAQVSFKTSQLRSSKP